MTHGQLFAGIGGFGLAAQWAGIENVWANEIDSFCCKVLRKNFSNLEIHERDIREIGNHNLESVDIISGGFPCQPFSHAGKRKGTEDDRYLWPEMLRVIQEVKPSWVIGENVAGLISMENGKTLERILIDLEDSGYHAETFLIPACSVGAWHRRNRIWIIANNSIRSLRQDTILARSKRSEKSNIDKRDTYANYAKLLCQDVSNTESQGLPQRQVKKSQEKTSGAGFKCSNTQSRGEAGYWSIEPNVGRVANGIPSRVDRLKGLGNSIVPQVAFEFFKPIVISQEIN